MVAWRGIAGAYGVAVVASVAAFLLVLLVPDLTAHHERASAGLPRRSVWSVLLEHRRTLLTLGTGILAIAAARGARASLLPLWAEHIGLSAADTSLVFGIAGALDMLLFYPAGAVMDRFGRAWIAVPTVVILGLGMMALPLTGSMPALTAVALVMALGNGIGSGIVMTLGADAAPADARPQFLGGWRLFADFGLAAGPLLISAITVVAPLAVACLGLGGLAIAGGGWLARWVPRYDPVSRTAPGAERCGSSAPSRLVAAQRLLALRAVVHDPLRVPLGIPVVLAPRLVRCPAGQVAQLGDPSPHVLAVGVELQPLRDGVEHPEVGGRVGPGARDPLPAVAVAGDVAVAQVARKWRAPCGHQMCRSLTRKLAVIIRTRLCIHPSASSWRMPASTMG